MHLINARNRRVICCCIVISHLYTQLYGLFGYRVVAQDFAIMYDTLRFLCLCWIQNVEINTIVKFKSTKLNEVFYVHFLFFDNNIQFYISISFIY